MAEEEFGPLRGCSVTAARWLSFRSFTGPLVLFQRVLGARRVPVGTAPSDARTLLEAEPDRTQQRAFGERQK